MWSISAGEEPPAEPPVIALEVVTITATKTERSAFEVPASMSIVGPERIESEQPQRIDDLREELPNVELVSGPRWIGEMANLRGDDQVRIVTTIDEARQNFNPGHQGRFFIEPDPPETGRGLPGLSASISGSRTQATSRSATFCLSMRPGGISR
jgi:hemoglobin/transferrin/lactoferrin receptor protein